MGHILRESPWPTCTERSALVGKNTVSRSTRRHPRVDVSRVQAHPRISRNADSIRERLRNGARTVVVDTAGQLIELDNKTFASAGDEWTLRFTAGSQARIHLDSPLPATAHIVATDAATVEVTGHVHLWAYTHATVTAFDQCRVVAHNHAFIRACDHSAVWADDNVVVHAYDEATVQARDHAILALSDEARAVVETAVVVRGPARKNVTMRDT
ncbi:hypothetical protein EEB14_28255 [Rhodococcus sp. WS4]|nr:hypothetical protein EEB14_28255 [Rhodococcus sp. WS4]